MNSFMISIRPKWCAKIFNGEKTREIRKTAPKDWADYLSGKTKIKPKPMTGYIYCTQGGDVLWENVLTNNFYINLREDHVAPGVEKRNGKVVAKFTLMEVESIYITDKLHCRCEEHEWQMETPSLSPEKLCESSCLDEEEIWDYLTNGNGYAYHISDLQIFDEPKELNNFRKVGYKSDEYNEAIREAEFILTMDHVFRNGPDATVSDHQFKKECEDAADEIFRIKRAPQSWCYVEVAE